MMTRTAQVQRMKRHRRVRKNIFGTPEKPRLAVYRSNRHIYAQLIDDLSGRTVASAASVEPTVRSEVSGETPEAAARVGKLVAERAIEKGIQSVVFDRGGFRYHGRVKTLADAAREQGLKV
ncbi:MAG: 50S ribosomal protein L18 [Actinomycetota bacterium]